MPIKPERYLATLCHEEVLTPEELKNQALTKDELKMIGSSMACYEQGQFYDCEQMLKQLQWECDVLEWEVCDERWLTEMELDFYKKEF